MFRVLLFFLTMLRCMDLSAQPAGNLLRKSMYARNEACQDATQPVIAIDPDTSRFMCVLQEDTPRFSGDVQQFIRDHLHYPDSAFAQGIEGKAFVRFTVQGDGTVVNPGIARSSGDRYLDAEALRIVSIMPPFVPGKQKGRAVDESFTLPVTFIID